MVHTKKKPAVLITLTASPERELISAINTDSFFDAIDAVDFFLGVLSSEIDFDGRQAYSLLLPHVKVLTETKERCMAYDQARARSIQGQKAGAA